LSKKNVVARQNLWNIHWQNDWSEQTIAFKISKKNDTYYIIYGDFNIYTSLTDVINRINPKIEYAVMKDANKIVTDLSDRHSIGTFFELWINSKKVQDISVLIKHKQKQIVLTNLLKNIAPSDLVEIRLSNIEINRNNYESKYCL
jgi:pullulanase